MPAIILSHMSALAFWSSTLSSLSHKTPEADRQHAILNSAHRSLHMQTLENAHRATFLSRLPYPLDLLVPSNHDFRKTSRASYHVCTVEPPSSSLITIDGESIVHDGQRYSIHVCSPELCLAQLARSLSKVELLELAFELCGCYAITPRSEKRLLELPPRTTPERIREFCASASGVRGINALKKIAPSILANSRSPKESQIGIASYVRRPLGGFATTAPLLNTEIRVSKELRVILGGTKLVSDLYYPDIETVIEYESDEYHGSETRYHDARKSTVYGMLGIREIPLTYNQLNDLPTFENIMNDICARQFPRRKPPTEKQLEARERLHRWLLHGKRTPRVFAE